jgi:hypothetical protein
MYEWVSLVVHLVVQTYIPNTQQKHAGTQHTRAHTHENAHWDSMPLPSLGTHPSPHVLPPHAHTHARSKAMLRTQLGKALRLMRTAMSFTPDPRNRTGPTQGGGGTGGGAGGGAAQVAAQQAVARHLVGLAGPAGPRLAIAAVPALFCSPEALGFAAAAAEPGGEWLRYEPAIRAEPVPGSAL